MEFYLLLVRMSFGVCCLYTGSLSRVYLPLKFSDIASYVSCVFDGHPDHPESLGLDSNKIERLKNTAHIHRNSLCHRIQRVSVCLGCEFRLYHGGKPGLFYQSSYQRFLESLFQRDFTFHLNALKLSIMLL